MFLEMALFEFYAKQSIKGIKLVLPFRLDIPEESIFIEVPHEIDKRIKFNSEFLKITWKLLAYPSDLKIKSK